MPPKNKQNIPFTNVIDISEWQLLTWDKPSKGSRPNSVYQDPKNGLTYFFKQSSVKSPTEIWSEIIASKLGQFIGFKTLDYNVGIRGDIVGCLSRNMIDRAQPEDLYHGIDILKDAIPNYELSKKPVCSFQNWEKIISVYDLDDSFLQHFIQIISLDFLVGNTDRHTENWAFIRKWMIEVKTDTTIKPQNKFLNIFRKMPKYIVKTKYKFEKKLNLRSAPIYDTGSCLGRELIDENILKEYTAGIRKIETYIAKGQSEIRWENTQLTLFEIVKRVFEKYPEKTKAIIEQVVKRCSTENVLLLVSKIDSHPKLKSRKSLLTLQRKQFIHLNIMKRVEILKKIIND